MFLETLEAVGDDNVFVVHGEVLDECWWSFDDICIKPEDPCNIGTEGGEEEGVAGFGHGGPSGLLGRHCVPVLFVLGYGGVKVLSEDMDGGEAVGG